MSDESQPIRASLAGICPLCGVPLDLNSSACRRCGVTPKRVGQCFHCRSTSSVRADPDVGWVCEVCGGARLVHVAFEQDPAIREHLVSATRNKRRSRVLRAVSATTGLLAAALVLFALLVRAVFDPSASAFAVMTVIPLLGVVSALVALARAKTLRTRTAASLEQAQGLALANVLADFPNGAVASQLASLLQISHTRAEQLLTHLNVRDDIESMVADDGQLLFRIRDAGLPSASTTGERFRVPAEAGDTAAEDEPAEQQRSPEKVRSE